MVPTKLFIASEPLYTIEEKSYSQRKLRTEFSTEITSRYIFIKFQGRQRYYSSEYEAKKNLKQILETEILEFNKASAEITKLVQDTLKNLFPNSLEFIKEEPLT